MKLILFLLLFPISSSGQTFKNLDFSRQCDTSKTGFCHWDISWGGKEATKPVHEQQNDYLSIIGATEEAVGFVEQSAILDTFSGFRIIELSANIRSEAVVGKGAGLNINIYSTQGGLMAYKSMGYASVSWVTGTTGWKRYTLRILCPRGAGKVSIGAIQYGKGQSYFDDFEVHVIPVVDKEPGHLVKKYVTRLCNIIEQHSLLKDSFDVEQYKPTALKIAASLNNDEGCYLATDYLLQILKMYGDYHSFLMTGKEVRGWKNNSGDAAGIQYTHGKVMDSCGYVWVPPFHGGNPSLMKRYADSMQILLKSLDGAGVKGWIIDLRDNTGGNMGPMIAGLGPVFDSEKLGSLVDVYGKADSWSYKSGMYSYGGKKVMTVSSPAAITRDLPIAVLISGRTGSSGEIAAISFAGNNSTRFFGQPTWGLTTGNGGFDLPHGARLMLASTVMADRTGHQYKGSVQPDEVIAVDKKDKVDKALQASVNWIKSFKKQ